MKTIIRPSNLVLQLVICFLLACLAAGCLGNYGRYKRDSEVFQAFNNNQVPLDYRYYYYHSGSFPIAVIGVEKKFDAGSRMWREVEPDTQKFRDMIIWIWEDYGYSRFAARILDPSGNQVGVLYTSIREVAIKFTDDNRIVVMPHTPFLWGPGAENKASDKYLGSTDSNGRSALHQRASHP
jgi:hypothetical protein